MDFTWKDYTADMSKWDFLLSIFFIKSFIFTCPPCKNTIFKISGHGLREDPYFSYYIGIRNKEKNTMKMYEFEQITVGAKVEPPKTNNPVLIQAELENDPNETKEDIAKTKAAAKKHLGMVLNKVAIWIFSL